MPPDYNAIVAIPEEAKKASGRRVFITTRIEYIPEKQYNQDSRISIGISISDTEMYPNSNYKVLFPKEHNKYVPFEKKLPEFVKIIEPYAWICIDGSNDICDAVNVYEAENGYDKSGRGGPVVSYMWAVSSVDGMPITYLLYRGSRVDSVDLKEMVQYLAAYGITPQGVILDGGFYNIDDVVCLRKVNWTSSL